MILLAFLIGASGAGAQRPARAYPANPAAKVPLDPAPTLSGYDFFVVAGQSNARGKGDMNLSEQPEPGTAYEWTRENEFRPLIDPVGQADTGSAWPAFAKAYTERTGRGVVILALARPGSIQFKHAYVKDSTHWDIRYPDNLYDWAARVAAHAYPIVEASLPDVRFGGWLWIQGGADARVIEFGHQLSDGSTVMVETIDDYEAALHRMARQIVCRLGRARHAHHDGAASRHRRDFERRPRGTPRAGRGRRAR